MFRTGDLLPVDGVPDGTTLLCVGPPMAGKRQLALSLLATNVADGDATVLVSTDGGAAAMRRAYESTVGEASPGVGVVDCSGGAYEDRPTDEWVRRVATPSDLGAIGTATTELVEAGRAADPTGRVRVGLFSLTTLALNSDGASTVRFVHSLTHAVEEWDGFAVLTAHSNSFDRTDLARVRDLVDGVVAVREAADGLEVRVDGLPDAPDEWTHVSTSGGVRADVEVARPTEPDAKPVGPTPRSRSGSQSRSKSFATLTELLERVDGDRPTLTVCNRESSDEEFARIRSFFAERGVGVRETNLGTEQPRDVATLHRGPELLATSPLQALAAGVAAATAESDPFERRAGPDVLRALDERVFGASGVEKGFLVDASTAIETTAWRTGEGRMLAGFQELSRYWESPRTRRVVDRVAAAGVDVHVFGVPDVVPSPSNPRITVHPDESEEIATHWFVAYDGAGRPDRTGALVVRDDGDGVYHGFWTYDPGLAGDVFEYLDETYRRADETGQQART